MSMEEPRTSILYFIVAGIRHQVGFPCLDFTREDAAMSIERYGELYMDRTEAASTGVSTWSTSPYCPSVVPVC